MSGVDTGKLTITLDNRDLWFDPAKLRRVSTGEVRRDWRWLWLRKRTVEHGFWSYIHAPLPTVTVRTTDRLSL